MRTTGSGCCVAAAVTGGRFGPPAASLRQHAMV